jgi:predicted membrane protein
MGSISLIVPPGVSVTSDVSAIMGSAINKAHELGRAGMMTPRVYVHGTAFMGEVKVLVREPRT